MINPQFADRTISPIVHLLIPQVPDQPILAIRWLSRCSFVRAFCNGTFENLAEGENFLSQLLNIEDEVLNYC